MRKLRKTQIEIIAAVEQSIPKVMALSERAKAERLFLLERNLRGIAHDLRDAVDLQARAFRDESLVDVEPLFPQGFFPYGRKE